jgi:tetratricopeptide (TPR) repeat protein
MRLRVLVSVCLVCCAAQAWADTTVDADTEAAKRHFGRGRTLYDAGSYDEACNEFTEAKRVLDLPAFDYNLAKCDERRERWRDAIGEYQRFLDRAPGDPSAPEVTHRVSVLRARLGMANEEQAERDRRGERRLRHAAIGVAVAAVVLGGAGFGAYYAEWGAYQHERSICAGTKCVSSSYAGLSGRVAAAEHAGYALWGVAGAAAVADVVLWVIDARRSAHVKAERAGASP